MPWGSARIDVAPVGGHHAPGGSPPVGRRAPPCRCSASRRATLHVATRPAGRAHAGRAQPPPQSHVEMAMAAGSIAMTKLVASAAVASASHHDQRPGRCSDQHNWRLARPASHPRLTPQPALASCHSPIAVGRQPRRKPAPRCPTASPASPRSLTNSGRSCCQRRLRLHRLCPRPAWRCFGELQGPESPRPPRGADHSARDAHEGPVGNAPGVAEPGPEREHFIRDAALKRLTIED